MRRNSLLVLLSMIVLLLVITGLLFYIFLRSLTNDAVVTGMVVPATLPVPTEQQLAPISEPVGVPMRLVYIVSVLVVFVSAILLLFRMLIGLPGKSRR